MNKSLVGIVLVFWSLTASALTPLQRNVLDIAYAVGDTFGYPETVQAIVYQETHAGAYGVIGGMIVGDHKFGTGKKAYGVMQIRLATARFVLHKFDNIKDEYFGVVEVHDIPDEILIAKLLTDTHFNILIGGSYFNYLINSQPSWSRAVAAYNMGPTAALKLQKPQEFKYTVKINIRIRRVVRPYNNQY